MHLLQRYQSQVHLYYVQVQVRLCGVDYMTYAVHIPYEDLLRTQVSKRNETKHIVSWLAGLA